MRSRHVYQALSLALCGCAGAEGLPLLAATELQGEVQLIDNAHWQPYATELDVWPEHQPAQIDCDPSGWLVELDRLEVNTGQCNYALLEHPALADAPSGSRVQLQLWHFDLAAPAPAQAHIAIAFGAVSQWETFVEIPQPGNVHRVEFTTTRALAQGDPIRVHLHNHGENSWMLSAARARAAPAGTR